MLAKICEGIPDALAQLKDKGATFLAEYKYDGQRAQIHLLPDGSVRNYFRADSLTSSRSCTTNFALLSRHAMQDMHSYISNDRPKHAVTAHLSMQSPPQVKVFSRNCEERTQSFPDVADAIRSAAEGTIHCPVATQHAGCITSLSSAYRALRVC